MSNSLRDELTTEQRSLELELVFDPIFINQRKIETVMGDIVRNQVDIQVAKIPFQTPEWMRTTRMHHIYSKVVLDICNHVGVKTLSQALATGTVSRGMVICSIEKFLGTKDVYEKSQITLHWLPSFETDYEVNVELSTSYITCDTGRLELSKKSEIGIVAQVENVNENQVILRPLVMGAPTLGRGKIESGFDTTWYGYSYFENFPEDIDEFNKIKDVPFNIDWAIMENIPEAAIKHCFCELLGEIPSKDWGGEKSDLFTSAIHLNGRRTTASFLLKGPAKFRPMTPAHLGKNGDQICRLSSEPSELMIVQHSHEIETSVREILRVFAVQPGRPRRYCLIDGRDTFRILTAYNWVDKALMFHK